MPYFAQIWVLPSTSPSHQSRETDERQCSELTGIVDQISQQCYRDQPSLLNLAIMAARSARRIQTTHSSSEHTPQSFRLKGIGMYHDITDPPLSAAAVYTVVIAIYEKPSQAGSQPSSSSSEPAAARRLPLRMASRCSWSSWSGLLTDVVLLPLIIVCSLPLPLVLV